MAKKLLVEVGVVTAVLIVATRLLHTFSTISFINEYQSFFFALMFLYVPLFVLKKRGRRVDFLDSRLSSFFQSLIIFLISAAVVFPLFFLGAHLWQTSVFGFHLGTIGLIPKFGSLLLYQVVMVALPEEFYFRGYMQSTLNLVFPSKWRFLGTNLGWGWIVTAMVFAFSHSVIMLQWWHFAIFFPALLFGYLRGRTGSITASILFHSASNIAMALVVAWYQ